MKRLLFVLTTVFAAVIVMISCSKEAKQAAEKEIVNESIEIPDSAYQNRQDLVEFDVPEGTTRIGNYAFAGCVNLKKITIPESVKEIGHQAFFKCISLPIIDGIRYADCCLVKVIDNVVS